MALAQQRGTTTEKSGQSMGRVEDARKRAMARRECALKLEPFGLIRLARSSVRPASCALALAFTCFTKPLRRSSERIFSVRLHLNFDA